jgi:hypothetical protein
VAPLKAGAEIEQCYRISQNVNSNGGYPYQDLRPLETAQKRG